MKLTVVFVEDAVDDWVAAAGNVNKHLRHSVRVDKGALDVGCGASGPIALRRIMLVHQQRHHLHNTITHTHTHTHTHTLRMANVSIQNNEGEHGLIILKF